MAREAIEVTLQTREAFPEAAALIGESFSIEEIDDDVLWIFSLHNKTDDQEYDYLAIHAVEVDEC